nr:hypothetical protein Itr_chr07CG09730 [Ipomoea trifida]
MVDGGGSVNFRRGRSTDGWPSEIAVVPAPLTAAASLSIVRHRWPRRSLLLQQWCAAAKMAENNSSNGD